ncbi:hypothetical protein G5V57_06295 [Nordella sp. HKS 07]|uniref:mandelate racemase/muconate lactonizing enzyme family protein n=1 Tax=Nordella sp. HKS 07 TaxID=2712222 RepID=UPI0013E10D11|nr:enolase C-terminal domain-like protein [Nordella sp. HKS 07]QIG47381.1 hypothetical protein G5V57_06295 [Nordella sp. HKS 07]
MTGDTSIERIETWAVDLPLPGALSFGAFTVTARQYAAVRVVTEGGLVADCLGHTRRSPVDVAISDLLAPRLVGKNALETAARFEDMSLVSRATDEDGVIGRARSLLDICLWDLKAQARGAPLWKLLGGTSRKLRVALVEGYEIAGESEDDIAERLIARAGQGYRFFKLEAAHYCAAEPVRRILTRVRQAVPDAEFTCDLAWSWGTARQGLEAAEMWRDLGIAWIEDPMARTRIAEIGHLTRQSPVPVGVGDECTRARDLEALMDHAAIDVVRVDATTIGGIGPALSLAAKAKALNLRVSYHVNPEVHRHCVFASDAADHIEIFPADRPFDCSHILIERPAFDDIKDGHIEAPGTPGTGLKLKDDMLERYAYRHAVQKRA